MENYNFYAPYNYFEDRAEHLREEHFRRVTHQVDLRRTIRDVQNPFNVSLAEFRKIYRMPQHLLMDLIRVLEPYCQVRTAPYAVPLHIRVMCAVSFYASGSYQRVSGRMSDVSVSQASVSNFITEITEVFNVPAIMSQYIKFPRTREDREQVIQRNSRLGLPRVLGYIDGTYVKIFPPTLAEFREAYYCRKGYTAINVLMVCDADLNILCMDASFPGSCNDPYSFRNSGVRNEMIVAYRESRCWLLGDSGYGHEPWLHLPLPHAARGTPEAVYSKAHCKARNAIERCFGVLKGRWRCLLHDRTLHYNPIKAGKIINACAVIHNFLRRHNVPGNAPVNLGRDQGEDHFDEIDLPLEIPQRLRDLANQELQHLILHVNARQHEP